MSVETMSWFGGAGGCATKEHDGQGLPDSSDESGSALRRRRSAPQSEGSLQHSRARASALGEDAVRKVLRALGGKGE